MPDLNENLKWSDVNKEDRDAFQQQFSMPTLERFPVNTKLYRFSDDPSPTLHKGHFSPWWSPYERHKDGTGWEDRVRFAQMMGVSVREYGRLTSVIQEDRNSCAFLKIIQLKEPVWGFVGGLKEMPRPGKGPSKVLAGEGRGPTIRLTGPTPQPANLPGGATQIYIPGLSEKQAVFVESRDLKGM